MRKNPASFASLPKNFRWVATLGHLFFNVNGRNLRFDVEPDCPLL